MTVKRMPCLKCCPAGGGIFDRDGRSWVCRNCGNRQANSRVVMLDILREHADSPEQSAVAVVIKMDAEIKRLRAPTPNMEILAQAMADAMCGPDEASWPYLAECEREHWRRAAYVARAAFTNGASAC